MICQNLVIFVLFSVAMLSARSTVFRKQLYPRRRLLVHRHRRITTIIFPSHVIRSGPMLKPMSMVVPGVRWFKQIFKHLDLANSNNCLVCSGILDHLDGTRRLADLRFA